MVRRIDIELTSTRADGTWTWRAAGAREPRGTIESDLVPDGTNVGDVVRAELEGFIDGMQVVSVLPPKKPRSEPERLELLAPRSDDARVATPEGGPSSSQSKRPGRGRDARDRRQVRGRSKPADRTSGQLAATNRAAQGEGPSPEKKPKPRRLRPAKVHRTELLESLRAEEQPIAEQLLQGGIPAVRQAIQNQNEELRAQGKPAVSADPLLQIAERLRPRALAATWRDRADAALAQIDDLDLRDLRSVVNAADDAGRDADARAVAAQLRDALARRLEKEHADWIAEVTENVIEGRVVRALRLSSRPPKAGSPLPADVSNRLVEATGAALTGDTSPQRWATVLEALAYSPIRRRVVPSSLPKKLEPELRSTIARLATRLPDIGHIFDITPDEAPARGDAPDRRRSQSRRAKDRKEAGRRDDGGRKSGSPTKVRVTASEQS